MKFSLNSLLPLLALTMLASLAYWLNHTVSRAVAPATAALKHEPDAIAEDFSARQLGDEGSVRYTLQAKKMLHYPDDDSTHLEAVFFDGKPQDARQQEQRFSVSAQNAQLSKNGDEVFLEGKVELVKEATPDSPRATIRTSKLRLVPDAGLAQTAEQVEMRSENSFIIGKQFEYNNKTRKIKLAQVKASYVVQP
ncbi:MAG: LPS export ABC transporter periplasmic protein LptC [Burkholderiales bacterium]